ncbi:MAG: hypothetical protein RLP12_05995 [Ekhidna sp.]
MSALQQGTAAGITLVHIDGIATAYYLHQAGNAFAIGRTDEQMHVVSHQKADMQAISIARKYRNH